MTGAELIAEGRRRFQRATPNLPIEYFDRWLALALSRGGTIVLTLDGARAEYPTENASDVKVRAAKGVT